MTAPERPIGAPAEAWSSGARWTAAESRAWLRTPSANDHKVNRGVLGTRIGSSRYPGAAVLGVSAAWRTGVGMVRYVPPLGDSPSEFGLPHPAAAILAARPETLFGDGACSAWVVGSGTDAEARSFAERETLERLQLGAAPLVIDAGALDTALARTAASGPAVLTPHLGEFRRLWDGAGFAPLPDDAASDPAVRAAAVSRIATKLSATVLLKGSITLIASPGGQLFSAGPATPWLATAGTGDVLAGILGALVASHATQVCTDPELLAPIAATAALVHDVAARLASGDGGQDPEFCTGAPVTALDVANAVPEAIRHLRER